MTVSWWTIALQAINFLVLVWLLHRFLYRPALAVMARRRQLVEEAMGEAEQAKQAADAEKDAYRARETELDESRQTLLSRAHAEIADDRERVLAEAHEQAENLLSETRRQLDEERRVALAAVKGEVADLARTMATKLLTRLTEAPDTGTALADLALASMSSHLEELPEDERATLAEDLTNASEALCVTTTRELDAASRERWQAMLTERLGRSVVPTFRADPALIGGAELRFPHAVISLTWADQLDRARAALLAEERSDDVAH
jgi:F-type H+-transporting ATPase subunit b